MRRLDDYARQTLGVPYRYQGRDPAAGLDCMGVMLGAFASCGVVLPDLVPAIQEEEGSRYVVERGLAAYVGAFQEIARESARPLDVVLFTDTAACANHVAVVCNRTHAIHASERHGVHLLPLRPLLRTPGVRVYRYAM